MSEGQKTNDSQVISEILLSKYGITAERVKFAFSPTKYTSLVDLKERYDSRDLLAYDIWDYGIGELNYDWTIELAQRSLSWDHSKFGIGSPFFFTKDNYQESPIQSVGLDNYFLDDFLISSALDTHTFLGKTCLNIFLRNNKGPIELDSEVMGWGVFLHEGMLKSNYAPYDKGVFWRWQKSQIKLNSGYYLSELTSPAVEQYFVNEVIPKLNKIRQWIVVKNPDAIQELKLAFFSKDGL
jgi:hypothetical protein